MSAERIANKQAESLLVDPMWLAIESAAAEDEELSPEERTALELSDTPAERRESIPHSEILREFAAVRPTASSRSPRR